MNHLFAPADQSRFDQSFARVFGAPPPESMMNIDINSAATEPAPLLKLAQSAPQVILAIEPRSFRVAAFRERRLGEAAARWPIQLDVAADVRGPALAAWLRAQASNMATMQFEQPSRMTELRLADLQKSLAGVETADPPQDRWLEQSVEQDETGFKVRAIGTITAATTDRQLDDMVSRASDGEDPAHIRTEFQFMRLAARNGDVVNVAAAPREDDADDEDVNEHP